MESVIVLVYAVMNPHAIQLHPVAFQDAHAVVSAGSKKHIPNSQVAAAEKHEKMRTFKIAVCGVLSWTSIVALSVKELRPVPVDGPLAFDTNILRVRS
jgi:hypothetical protein